MRTQEPIARIKALTSPLIALTVSGMHGTPLGNLDREMLLGINWSDLLRLAKAHDLLPLVSAGVAASGLKPPPEAATALRTAGRIAELQADRAWDQLATIADAFQAHGIDLILLKGVALAVRYYRSPGLRPFGDLDLFVQANQRDQAAGLLRGLGYANFESEDHKTLAWSFGYHYHWTFMPSRGFMAELHWALLPPESPVDLDYDGLWTRSVPNDLPCGAVRILSPEDELLYLALHIAKHHFSVRLRNLMDIAALLDRNPALNWDEFLRRAESSHAGKEVAAVLGTAARLGLIILPNVAALYLSRLGSGLDFQSLARHTVHWVEADLPAGLLDILTASSWQERGQCLRKTFLPRYDTFYGEHLASSQGQPTPKAHPIKVYLSRYAAHLRKWGRELAHLRRDSHAFWTAVKVRRQMNR